MSISVILFQEKFSWPIYSKIKPEMFDLSIWPISILMLPMLHFSPCISSAARNQTAAAGSGREGVAVEPFSGFFCPGGGLVAVRNAWLIVVRVGNQRWRVAGVHVEGFWFCFYFVWSNLISKQVNPTGGSLFLFYFGSFQKRFSSPSLLSIPYLQ